MVKQAVKVVVRARPTANFATKNIKMDTATGVFNIINVTFDLDCDNKH